MKNFALLENVRNLLQTNATLPTLTLDMLLHDLWKLKIQIFCRCGTKRKQIAFLIASPSNFLCIQKFRHFRCLKERVFPHNDYKYNFHLTVLLHLLLLRSICGTGNSSLQSL